MNSPRPSSRVCLLVVLGAGIWSGCSTSAGGHPGDFSASDASASGSSPENPAMGGAGSGGSSGGGGISGSGGAASSSGAGSSRSGSASAGIDGGAGGLPEAGGGPGTSGGSSGGADGSAAAITGGADGSTNTGTGVANCNLPATVGFQKDVQPFLIASCGGGGATNAGSGGCHVIDSASTTAAGGYNHAYDWLTGTAHSSSCPEMPTPERFQIVMAVVSAPNPPSCSKSRKMPPPDATGANLRAPLTACQAATLQAWLNEPLVTQTHRADGISPTTPYAMPPFN